MYSSYEKNLVVSSIVKVFKFGKKILFLLKRSKCINYFKLIIDFLLILYLFNIFLDILKVIIPRLIKLSFP